MAKVWGEVVPQMGPTYILKLTCVTRTLLALTSKLACYTYYYIGTLATKISFQLKHVVE